MEEKLGPKGQQSKEGKGERVKREALWAHIIRRGQKWKGEDHEKGRD